MSRLKTENRLIRFKNQNYNTICNVFLRDSRLSLKAKGLLSLVMSLSEDWDFTIDGISSIVREGKTAIYGAIDELKSCGYCVVSVVRDSRGVIQGTDYKFYETPNSENPHMENPYTENPHTENLNAVEKAHNANNKYIIIDKNKQTNQTSSSSLFDDIEITKEEKDKEKNLQKKESEKELFECCWVAYNRKGSKKKSREQWVKLTDAERSMVMPHIRAYVSTRELVYQRDFERYLRDRVFMDAVFDGKSIVYDPTRTDGNTEYRPATDGQIHWNDNLGCWLFTGFDETCIFDGYDDADRPDGAEIRMNNGRGLWKWDADSQKWVKQ